jgi:outer membrane protein OmpA-like peptidoglycan-associated protein/tetratricopeptide (TPR) repeat protein
MIICLSSKAQLIDGGGVQPTAYGGIKKADEAYNNLNYAYAIPIYEAYLKKNNTDAAAYVKLGDCYRLTLNFEKARDAYAMAVKNNSATSDYILKYAQSLQTTGDYEKALEQYKNYTKVNASGTQVANNQMYALQHIDNYTSKNRFSLKNAAFNTPQYDFAPMVYKEGLLYTSSKDASKAIQNVSAWTGTTFFDIYYTKVTKLDFNKKSGVFIKDKNTKLHDGVIAFLPNKDQFYYTRNNFTIGKSKTAKKFKPTQNMYLTSLGGKNETAFEFNSDDYNIGQPTLTADGNTMYFVSDMPGGFGGKDIYVSNKKGDKWSAPKNLGNKINTAGDEMFPYIHNDNKSLYFASNGHGGLGGLDIFRTTINESGNVDRIRNMESPINSSYDDFGLTFGKDKQFGYFTSNRTNGKGLDDIYGFEDAGVYYEGVVVDADTKQPICESTVQLMENNEAVDNYKTDCKGDFVFDALNSKKYCINATAQGYYPNTKTCRTIENMAFGEIVTDTIYMRKVKPVGVTVQVSNAESKQNIPNAKIIIHNSCNDKLDSIFTNNKGEVCFEVKCDCNYNLDISANNYTSNQINYVPKNDCESLKSCDEKNGKVITANLTPIKKATVKVEDIFDNISADGYIELKGIYYDLNKWTIRKESEVELNKLLTFLNGNPDAFVEIASHTDSRGSNTYNQKLSQKRAESVVSWLVEHNISKDRLFPKGYGESKLKNKCADGVKCTEEEHQLNRRTEFKVISNYKVIESKP